MTLVKRFVSSRHVWAFAGLYTAFWASAAFTTYVQLNVLIQCVTMGVSVAVLTAYGKFAFEAITERRPSREDHLLLGITLAWLGVFLRASFVLAWRANLLGPPPTEVLESDWITSFNFMIFLGGVLHVTAPGSLDGRIPRRNLIILGAAIGAGVALAMLVLTALNWTSF